jgi:hypothetical protein
MYVRFSRKTAIDSRCSIYQWMVLIKARVYSVRYELNPYIKYTLVLVFNGRIRSQPVSRWHLALGVRFRCPAIPRGICVGKSYTVIRVSPNNLL